MALTDEVAVQAKFVKTNEIDSSLTVDLRQLEVAQVTSNCAVIRAKAQNGEQSPIMFTSGYTAPTGLTYKSLQLDTKFDWKLRKRKGIYFLVPTKKLV